MKLIERLLVTVVAAAAFGWLAVGQEPEAKSTVADGVNVSASAPTKGEQQPPIAPTPTHEHAQLPNGALQFTPSQASLPVPPPEDARVLFNGSGTNLFVSMAGEKLNWPTEEGLLVSTANGRRSNHAVSQWHFRDAEIHVEFMLPPNSDGNSGVYIQAVYELQILNSLGKAILDNGEMGAVYGLFPPLTNATRKPGQWQVYNIRYQAPRRNAEGVIATEGAITAWLNGQKVQDNVRFGEPNSKYNPYRYGTTPYLHQMHVHQKATNTGPLVLQDHDAPVRFRNVWVRPLDDKSLRYSP